MFYEFGLSPGELAEIPRPNRVFAQLDTVDPEGGGDTNEPRHLQFSAIDADFVDNNVNFNAKSPAAEWYKSPVSILDVTVDTEIHSAYRRFLDEDDGPSAWYESTYRTPEKACRACMP